MQTGDKLNKDPISLYIQPLPVIDLCLQPAACSGLSPLSALQLTSANKGIILVVQQSSTPLSVWMIICVLTSEDWRARFQKCSNPVVLVQQPNVGKKWRASHSPRLPDNNCSLHQPSLCLRLHAANLVQPSVTYSRRGREYWHSVAWMSYEQCKRNDM